MSSPATMGRKVVHLTSVHSARDVRILHKQCISLRSAGYDVSIVAPGDYNESIEGVRILSVPQNSRRWVRMTATCWSVFRVALAEQAELYHIHDPELIPVGLVLKLLGKRVVYDAHEDLPKSILSKRWIPRWLQPVVSRAAEVAERSATAAFSGIVAATPSIGRRFATANLSVVQNYPLPSELGAHDTEPYDARPPAAAFVGGITVERGIRELVEATRIVAAKRPIRLVLAGSFRPASLEQQLRRRDVWKHIDFLGWCERRSLARRLGRVRIGVVTFLPRPNHIEAQPNKLFEYMSAGLPVVASRFPLWREVVEAAGCGLLVDPKNPEEIAEAISWLLEHPEESQEMGRRGRTAVLTQYNWDRESRALLDFYERLLLHTDRVRRPAAGLF